MNRVELSVVVSKDRDSFMAINKVSDNLTIVNTFVPAGRNEDGSYKKSANITVRLTSKTEKIGEVNTGSRLDVKGFFVVNSYTNKDGREIASLQIVANKVMVKEGKAPEKTETPENVGKFLDIPETFEEEMPFK